MEEENNQSDSRFNLLDQILQFLEYKFTIIVTVLSITVISLGISLVWPKTYKSTVQFVQLGNEGRSLGGLVGNIVDMPLMSDKVSVEQTLAILRSRELKDNVIDKFDLKEVYEQQIIEAVREKLENKTQIEEVRQGGLGFNPIVAIKLSYLSENPERAKKIASYYVQQLDSIVTNMNKEAARENYEVVQKRFRQNVVELKEAEDSLKSYQEEYGILEVETQSEQIIKNVASLKAELTSLQVKQNVLKRTVRGESSKLVELENQIQELRKKYNQMVHKSESVFKKSAKQSDEKLFHPVLDMPQLMMGYMRLYREQQVQQKIYEKLLPQLEQQKMLVKQASSGIRIVDDANMPTYKFKPKRAYIVIAGFLFSIIASILLVKYRVMIKRERRKKSDRYYKIQQIKKHLTSFPGK